MNDVDERLARLLDDAVPRPPRELDGAAIRNGRPRRRVVRIAAPALAAAAVVAIAVVAVVVTRPTTNENGIGTGGPTTKPTTVKPPTVKPPTVKPPTVKPPTVTDSSAKGQTEVAVQRLLAAAPVVPNTHEVGQPPAKELRHPMSQSSGNLVDHGRWWIGTGTVSSALHYFADHRPDGLANAGSGSASGPNEPTLESISFGATSAQWTKPRVYSNLELDIEAVQLGDQVGIRVDAQAVWLAQRTDAEQIPDNVNAVDVVVRRPGRAATVQRTLGEKDAQQLAAIINHLPVAMSGARSCPIDFGGTDTLTFHAGTVTRHVHVDPRGCQGVSVAGSARNFPGLSGGYKVDNSLMTMLGLPKNYGLRP